MIGSSKASFVISLFGFDANRYKNTQLTTSAWTKSDRSEDFQFDLLLAPFCKIVNLSLGQGALHIATKSYLGVTSSDRSGYNLRRSCSFSAYVNVLLTVGPRTPP